jgi:RNA-directed DNA polymerase
LDRLIQQAIAQVLGPIFDPTFSDSSFGFRPGRSAHNAVYQARRYIQQGYTIAVDMDLSKFFDTVQHDVLMHRLSRTLATQTGMTNRWLQKQGLLSVKELWVKIHYPAMAR